MASFDPTIVGAIRRFKRIVIIMLVVGIVGAGIYTFVAGKKYQSTAGIIISPLPANISPATSGSVGGGGSVSYTGVQIALLKSQDISNNAASIVNQKLPHAHISGKTLNKNLIVTPPVASTKATSGSIGSMTMVQVTLGGGKEAQTAANAILTAYEANLKLQINHTANVTIAAYDQEIQNAQNQLNGVPPETPKHSSTPHTTTTHPAHPATVNPTHPATVHHHVTTTHPPRTTTTTVPKTTTTKTKKALAAPGQVHLSAVAAPVHAVLLADTTATTAPAAASSSSSSSSSSVTAAERSSLLNLISALTKNKGQVQVNQTIDLHYHPTTQPATPQTTTGGRSWLLNLALGAIIGLILGMIAAYLLSISRRRFEGEEDPERLYQAPLLFAVPAFEVAYGTRPGLPILTEPAGEPAEAYRAVATALRAVRGTSDSMLVAFSAADLGAGTTTTVANTALALSEMGERVLVVDADPIGRGLTHLLSDPNRQMPGLADVLNGRPLAETVVAGNAGEGRLGLLPSSTNADMAVHRWRPGSMRAVFEEATERFDVVLVDTPPVGSSSYGVDVAAAAEHVALVIPHHDTVKKHAEIPGRLEVAQVTIVGYVYNGSPSSPTFVPYFPVLYTNGHAPRTSAPAAVASASSSPPTAPVPAAARTGQVPATPATPAPTDGQPAREHQ
ncbi:MAG TPA: AAA family ATPase [Acidimicrobiales bacterium]|nr:AAA family ATPase [Acidimicrobiales bacterium]